jgi:hypothetical protein
MENVLIREKKNYFNNESEKSFKTGWTENQ